MPTADTTTNKPRARKSEYTKVRFFFIGRFLSLLRGNLSHYGKLSEGTTDSRNVPHLKAALLPTPIELSQQKSHERLFGITVLSRLGEMHRGRSATSIDGIELSVTKKL